MPQHVCNGATLMCSVGAALSLFTVLPVNRVMTSSQPAATIMDHEPIVKIAPFGVGMILAKQIVPAATTAALDVLTPQPCIPVSVNPRVRGAATVVLGNQPLLDTSCEHMCMSGGVIQVTVPGQLTELIP
jgi:Domain of unknown function (DUF4280)